MFTDAVCDIGDTDGSLIGDINCETVIGVTHCDIAF